MIRLTLLTLVVSGLAIYAFKDWYKSLCGLIVLMAVIEHPDMPKTMFGIQGLNPWNILLVVIVMAWAISRRREQLTWDMPRHVNVLLMLYFAVIVIGFFRMLSDQGGLIDFARVVGSGVPSTGSVWSEHFINTVKWVIPGLLLFDGCRNRSRFNMAMFSLLAVYVLLGVQVIRWMPLSEAMSGDSLNARSLKILVNEIGYHRVNLSMMLAGASWAILSTRPLVNQTRQGMFIVAAGLTVMFAQALTGGRAGYATWAVVGLVLGAIRWRKYLLVAPLIVVAIVWLVPGAMERMSEGFTPESRDVNPPIKQSIYYDSQPDIYTITAGRNMAWPYVIEKIGEAPVFGYGREAMQRTDISAFLVREFGEGEVFAHPHNAYLQWLLDNGWVGFLLILPFYLVVLRYAITLFRDSRSPVFVAIGGVTSALVLALLVASVGSQTFYPREGTVGMWCAIGLMFRVYVERARALAASQAPFPDTLDGTLWERAA